MSQAKAFAWTIAQKRTINTKTKTGAMENTKGRYTENVIIAEREQEENKSKHPAYFKPVSKKGSFQQYGWQCPV